MSFDNLDLFAEKEMYYGILWCIFGHVECNLIAIWT